ncbi:MAG: hypothetical protein M1820_001762 [Bogoriella megaspora]|nr:MAG: hypothetical protein M1820_001762 [Bogoriella megaspora]
MEYKANNGLSQELADEFRNHYADRKSGVKEHVERVKDILENAMKSGVFRAIPITTRMKELDSALGSLQRRQATRLEWQKLKTRMEDLGEDWEAYCKDNGQERRITAWQPFTNHKSMFDALHDFGGVRVCVYFPDDVAHVVSFLEQHEGIKIMQNTRKMQASADVIDHASTDLMDLRNHLNMLERRHSQPDQRQPKGINENGVMQKNFFSGYRATHVVVELLGDAIPEEHKDCHHKVEIQIGTVVMHAWAQIEHDIIYKPGAVEPSEDEKGILDLFNGIVTTGEAALRQLAASTARKEKDRARDDNAPASNHYELGAWLANYCEQHSMRSSTTEKSLAWNDLDKLLFILRSSGDHTAGKLRELLEKARESAKLNSYVFGHDLPLHLLRAKFELETAKVRRFSSEIVKDRRQKTPLEAKYLAFRVVHSINMASYLGILDKFIKNIERALPSSSELPRPSLIDFLDLLHPYHPRSNGDSEDKVIDFCEAFLSEERLRAVVKDPRTLLRMELPLLLTDIGRVVYPSTDASMTHNDVFTVIPRVLCGILDDPEHTHWIPEIFFTAEEMSRFSPDVKFLLRVREINSDLVTINKRNMLSLGKSLPTGSFHLRATEKDYTLNALMTVEQGSSTWWAGQTGDSGTAHPSWHIDKYTKRQRKIHPGYFEPPLSDEHAPAWRYVPSGPAEWSVKTVDMCKVIASQPIEKRPIRTSQWIEFAKYLNPECNVVPKIGSKDYTFEVAGIPFVLESLQNTFRLTRLPPPQAESVQGPISEDSVDQELKEGSVTDVGTQYDEEEVFSNKASEAGAEPTPSGGALEL